MHGLLVPFILGVIEGVTEFIPISSTGHLLIAEKLLHSHRSLVFNVVIQCGAVVAVIPLFRQRISQFIFHWRERKTQLYMLKILLAFAITGMGGLVIDHYQFKLPENLAPIAWALLIGGLAFLAVEWHLREKPLGNQVTWGIVLAVGFGQLVAAVFPGTSRSGSTILFSLMLGLNRPLATEFSFLVGIPTMLAAGGWELFKATHHPASEVVTEHWDQLLFASVVAAIVSFIVVKWLLRYIQTHTFSAFGWYRIVLALGMFLFFMK